MGTRSAVKSLRNKKGSLAVEACIVLPIFLSALLFLLFFIRLACIQMTLNHAVHETAKQMAANCYPVTFLNEIEDEFIEDHAEYTIPGFGEELKSMGSSMADGVNSEDLFSRLLSGKLKSEDITELFKGMAGSAAGAVGKDFRSYLTGVLSGKYFDVKSKAKYAAAGYLLKKYCKGSLVDLEKIKLKLVDIPQGEAEFYYRGQDRGYTAAYGELGCSPFAENVVIAVEYKMEFSIPFFGKQEWVTRYQAVERAWIHGGNEAFGSVGASGKQDDSGGTDGTENGGDPGRIVYVTKTGSKYHESGCMYLDKSRIPIGLDEAKRRGYQPCKVCVLKTAKDWRK